MFSKLGDFKKLNRQFTNKTKLAAALKIDRERPTCLIFAIIDKRQKGGTGPSNRC